MRWACRAQSKRVCRERVFPTRQDEKENLENRRFGNFPLSAQKFLSAFPSLWTSRCGWIFYSSSASRNSTIVRILDPDVNIWADYLFWISRRISRRQCVEAISLLVSDQISRWSSSADSPRQVPPGDFYECFIKKAWYVKRVKLYPTSWEIFLNSIRTVCTFKITFSFHIRRS